MSEKIDMNTRYVRKECQGTQVDDDLVIFDPETGFYFDIGGVGVVIWEMLAEPKSVSELCDKLKNDYEVDHERCLLEVEAFFSELEAVRLLSRVS